MKKFVLFLACLWIFYPIANAAINDGSQDNTELAMKVLSIKEQHLPNKKDIYYLEIDVAEATMDVYRCFVDEDGEPSLEFMDTYLVGTPKVRDYPRGFGVITSVEFNPTWMPTQASVELLMKHGINLYKFRNKDGKVVVPGGNQYNFMGPVKMRIKFVTPQKTAKTRRDVYRVHGILEGREYKKLLGTRCSGGCIRVENEQITDLAKKYKKENSAIILQYI